MALTLVAACCCLLSSGSSAGAAPITIGSPLTGTYAPTTYGNVITLTQNKLPVPGAQLTSPVNGAVIRWRIAEAAGGPFRLRILTPGTGTTYTGGASSAPVTPTAATGVQTFSTALPIKAGQAIAVDNSVSTDKIGLGNTVGAEYLFWAPRLAEGSPLAATSSSANREVALNADILPAPTVTSVSPSSGSFQGGTGVTIAGTDFQQVSSVTFGGVPAQSFGVGSEGQITAVAPAAAGPGPVTVAVTTVAGQTSQPVQFTNTACVVPKLKKKKVKADRKALRKAGCKLGKVTRKHKAGKKAKVTKQSAKPGTILPPGATVNVTVGK